MLHRFFVLAILLSSCRGTTWTSSVLKEESSNSAATRQNALDREQHIRIFPKWFRSVIHQFDAEKPHLLVIDGGVEITPEGNQFDEREVERILQHELEQLDRAVPLILIVTRSPESLLGQSLLRVLAQDRLRDPTRTKIAWFTRAEDNGSDTLSLKDVQRIRIQANGAVFNGTKGKGPFLSPGQRTFLDQTMDLIVSESANAVLSNQLQMVRAVSLHGGIEGLYFLERMEAFSELLSSWLPERFPESPVSIRNEGNEKYNAFSVNPLDISESLKAAKFGGGSHLSDLMLRSNLRLVLFAEQELRLYNKAIQSFLQETQWQNVDETAQKTREAFAYFLGFLGSALQDLQTEGGPRDSRNLDLSSLQFSVGQLERALTTYIRFNRSERPSLQHPFIREYRDVLESIVASLELVTSLRQGSVRSELALYSLSEQRNLYMESWVRSAYAILRTPAWRVIEKQLPRLVREQMREVHQLSLPKNRIFWESFTELVHPDQIQSTMQHQMGMLELQLPRLEDNEIARELRKARLSEIASFRTTLKGKRL